ncbi:nitrate- and nitrite sensing domain-containing protein [Marinicella rhabdoformis]|uniref:nitrate- and nitrite sensing domain-containing protein n=1 Tax=Marinicella rhabdoformis TaxID=2580566 RepID=UPI0012AED4E7
MRRMKNQTKALEFLQLISCTTHAFQAERGVLCMYLSDPTDDNLNLFQSCVIESDGLMNQISELVNESAQLENVSLVKSLDKINRSLNHFLSQVPYRVSGQSFTINASEALMVYTHQLISHLVFLQIELILALKPNKSVQISALSNFIKWKDRIGRERALGTMGINMQQFDCDMFLHGFEMLLNEQQVNKRTFLALADEDQKNLFNHLYIEHIEIEAVHKQITSSHTLNIKAKFWFELVSQKMDMMYELEQKFISALFSKPVRNTAKGENRLFNEDEIGLIEDYLLFRNLSTGVKKKLFQSSNVRDYKKGSLLFLEGEQASRIYVVISGWIKIFKNCAEGTEKIEHMLSSGDVVIESSIFESSNYSNNAQVSVEARLLSFPAAIYRHLVNQDLTLALNSLKYLSQSSTQYQQQVEANRVKSTKERVGHFLLKQFVAQKNPNTIMLPYEKTIIASLLDMKPETFSRSLKSFKQEGLTSEKQQIQVKNMKMLCEYCDKEIAQSCQFKQQHDCQFNETPDQLPTNARNSYKSRS